MQNVTANLTSDLIEDDWMSECDGSLLDHPGVRYPAILVYLLVFIVCLLGNTFTICVIAIHPLMRTSTNFFLANLAFADLLVAIFCIPQNMIHILGYENGHWPLGSFMCKMYVLMIHLVPSTSVGILICVSAEKYIAVLHPLTAMKILTQRLRIMVTLSVWLISLFINLPYYFNAKLFVFGETAACGRGSTMIEWITFSFILWYILPLLILGFIYFRIGHLLWYTSTTSSVRGNRTSSGQYEVKDSMGSNGGGPSNSWHMRSGRVIVYKQESLLQVPDDVHSRKRQKDLMEGRRKVMSKVVRLLAAVVLSFAMLTFPHHARLMHSVWSSEPLCTADWSILVQPISFISLFISSAINPILYAFLSRRFREATRDILHCKMGIFTRISRSRTRTLISDIPEDSRAPSPHPGRARAPLHARTYTA